MHRGGRLLIGVSRSEVAGLVLLEARELRKQDEQLQSYRRVSLLHFAGSLSIWPFAAAFVSRASR